MTKKTPPMYRHGDLIHVRLGPYDAFGHREQFRARIMFQTPNQTRILVPLGFKCIDVTSGDTPYSFHEPIQQWAIATAKDIQASRTCQECTY